MSVTGYLHQDKHYRRSTHQRNDSDELDVFEATRYFSGATEASSEYNSSVFSNKGLRQEVQILGGRRMSLDMQTRNSLPLQTNRVEKQIKDKKYKQPSSPGGRLASFLNSLFQQSASKKKKSKSMKDEEENPGGRRRRRSSISHFDQSVNTITDLKVMYKSSSSGFRTPPPCINTPTKVYKDHGQVVSIPKHNGNFKTMDEKKSMDLSLSWLDEKFKIIDGFSEKNKIKKHSLDKKDLRRVIAEDVDDGAESDSSSDLFELQNYDLGSYPSGLPVYETTRMESIKRGAPIS